MKIQIQWNYCLPKTKKIVFMKSELMDVQESLQLAEDLEKTGRLSGDIVFLDDKDGTWKKKDLERFLKQSETEPSRLIAYIDGGYDIKNKLAGIGVVLYFQQHHKQWRIRFNDQLEMLEDNNEAEYAALYRFIQQLVTMEIQGQDVTVHLDSLVVCKQASGEWPCFEQPYISWLDRIDSLAREHRITIHFEQIDRAANKEADQLATQALKGIYIESKIERV